MGDASHTAEPVASFKSLGTWYITGRGTVHLVELDRSCTGWPPFAGKAVEIDGAVYDCMGVEAFVTMGHHVGEKIGLLVKPRSMSKTL